MSVHLKELQNNEENEEKKLAETFSQLNSCLKSKNKDKLLDQVFNFVNENRKHDISFLRAGIKNTMCRSLTYNSLTDLDVNEAIENIVSNPNSQDDPESQLRFNLLSSGPPRSNYSTNVSNASFNALLSQNLEIKDEVLKIMMVGSSMVGKSLLISKFIDQGFREEGYVYFSTSGMEIKKICVKLNDKNVRIEFYDTDAAIHSKEITNSNESY